MIGKILGERYQVEQLLGKKAGLRTFLAQDLQSNQLVVIKLLTFSNDFEWDDLKLFEREAETLKSLNHPAIPRYLDYFEVSSDTTKGFALVQSYIEAKTLEQYLKAGRTFTEVEVKEIATALLEILIYLHSQNPPVIHRDIKPSNILLSDRSGNSVGKVYLIDFGSVQTVAAKEGGTMTVVGTYGYMAPEQFGGRAVPASDIYSLGATLIYLVTGSHPADLPQVDLKIEFEDKANVSKVFVEWLKLVTLPSLNRRCSSPEGALEGLTKPINIKAITPYNTFVNKKPAGSRIKLNRCEEYIEINIPRSYWRYSNKIGILALGIFNIILLAFVIKAGFHYLTLNLFILLIMIVLSPIITVVFFASNKASLKIDSQQISLTYELFGIKYNYPKPKPKIYINKLTYVPKMQHSCLNSRLTIWAGVHEFCLIDCGGLLARCSETETEWLAYELSEWLSIPITREEYLK